MFKNINLNSVKKIILPLNQLLKYFILILPLVFLNIYSKENNFDEIALATFSLSFAILFFYALIKESPERLFYNHLFISAFVCCIISLIIVDSLKITSSSILSITYFLVLFSFFIRECKK